MNEKNESQYLLELERNRSAILQELGFDQTNYRENSEKVTVE